MSLDQLLASHTAVGGVSLLLKREGEEVLRVTRGEAAPGVPMSSDTILLWLSSGKPVTAIAIALLIERKLVHLEARVAEYLPHFSAHGKETITLRDLLTHTAGLHRALHAVWELPPWDETLSRICDAELPAGFVPGQHAAYDPSAAWFLLGEIISRVAGEPWESFIAREIFAPAEMRDAAFSYSHERYALVRPRLAQYYNTASGKAHPLHWNDEPAVLHARPGASLRATVDDLARFYTALLEGRIVKPETLAQFTAPQRGRLPDKTFGVPMDWGLGIMVNNGANAPYGFGPAAGPRTFGHGGQQSSIAFADPDRKAIFAATYTTLPGEAAHHRRRNDLLTALATTLG